MRLLIINDFGIKGGGTENRVRLLLNWFLQKGCFEKIHLLQLNRRGICDNDNNEIIYHYSSGEIKETYRITRDIIKQEGIDIVQAHNMLALSPSGIRATKELKVPVVWFAHDYWPLCAKRSFIDPYEASKKNLCQKATFYNCVRCVGIRTWARLRLFRYFLKDVDIAISSCNFVKNLYEYHNFLKGRWKVVHPWIAMDTFLYNSNNVRDNYIVFTGSLLDYKGAWILAEAFTIILKEISDAKLKFVGSEQDLDNIYRKKMDRIFAENGIKSHVEFLGYMDWHKLVDLYRKAGVYVCPTICMESFGLNWAEAMGVGCPVVASCIGSLPDFLEGRAILVPPKNPAKLAEAIISILKNKDISEELSKKGVDYINDNFRVEHAADKVISLYRKCLNRKDR